MNNLSSFTTQIHFDPLLPVSFLITLAIIGVLICAVSFWKIRWSSLWRLACLTLFLTMLANPSLLQKEREPIKDVALVVVDQSTSQTMGEREQRTNRALTHLEDSLSARNDIDLRVAKAPAKSALTQETLLFDTVERNFADVPEQQRAGVIFLSDGQIHDVPSNPESYTQYGPVSVLLSGKKDERDRRIEIIEAPSYGIVGNKVTVSYRVVDTDNIDAKYARVVLNRFESAAEELLVPIGEPQTLELELKHAGENIFELSAEDAGDEITLANNKSAITVNGVRDRLKVLLVSGKPHAGGRTWRDLLTSDPGVDLVHFTILREPDKLDATPQNELALIAFPFRELFEIKLYDFDLIIFDRYSLNRILPQFYFRNIVTYVQRGGALLEASGPSFAGDDSVYYTDLGRILPASPDGNVMSSVFKPELSELGILHPVTEDLDFYGGTASDPKWGSWGRQISLHQNKGDMLMTGSGDNPLLILDRVEEGRVAQLASDHIWLWSRGYDGGGPHAELLRRVVHWLMKEPELDEKALDIRVENNKIRVRSRDPNADQITIMMTRPDGESEELSIERDERGFLEHIEDADQLGIYAFATVDGQKRFAIIGEQNPPELRDVLTTDEKLKPLIDASHGGSVWLEDTAQPAVRVMANTSHYAGRNWVGLRKNNAFAVKSVKSLPLLPAWAWLVLLAGLVVFTWWREGTRR